MEKKGLVKRVRDLEDRRAVRIVVTPKGKTVLKKTTLPYVEIMSHIISIYSETELKKATLLMDKFMKSIEEYADSGKNKIASKLLPVEQTSDFLNRMIATLKEK